MWTDLLYINDSSHRNNDYKKKEMLEVPDLFNNLLHCLIKPLNVSMTTQAISDDTIHLVFP